MTKFIGIGFELVGLIVFGITVGQWYDALYHTELGVVVGIILAFCLWMGHVIYLASKFY